MNSDDLEKNPRKRIAVDELEELPAKRPALDSKCSIANCDFCNNGVSVLMKYEMRKQGWKQRLVIAFNSLEKSGLSKGGWHSLTGEIYPFLETHWQYLWSGIEKEMEANWRKKVQDCLTHNKDMFESGVTVLGKKGYWRMAVRETAKPKISADKSPKSPLSDNSLTSSPINNTDHIPDIKSTSDLVAILSTLQKQAEDKDGIPKERKERNNGEKSSDLKNSSLKNRRSLLTQEDIALLQTLVKTNVIASVPTNNIPTLLEQPNSQPIDNQTIDTQFVRPTVKPISTTSPAPSTLISPIVQITVPNTPTSVVVAPAVSTPVQKPNGQQTGNEPQQGWGCEFKNFLSRSGIRKRSFDVSHLVGKNGGLSALSKIQL